MAAPKKKGNDVQRAMVLQMLAGAGAGAVTKTAIAPLERTKILFQLQGMSDAPRKYFTILGTLKTVAKEEGFLAWYKGNGANVLRVIPVYALKFAFNDTFKTLVAGPNHTGKLSTSQLMQAGTLAGLFQQLATYPLETVRTRLSIGTALGLHYTGIFDCFRKTVAHEGPTALYKGLAPTLVTGAPYVGLQMTCYELLGRHIPADTDNKVAYKMGAGALAGLVAQSITYPGDTLRRRMQTNGANGAKRLYSSTIDCLKQMLQKEGVISLYRGLSTNAVRAIPGAAIQFAVYDQLKALLGL